MSEDIVTKLEKRLAINFFGEDDGEYVREAVEEIRSLRKQLSAFYRIQSEAMNKDISKGLNPAQHSLGD